MNTTTTPPRARPVNLGTGITARATRKGLHLVHDAASTAASAGSCATGIGCMHLPGCADTNCPGRPKAAPRHRHEGLHRVDTDHAQPGGIYLGPVLPAEDDKFEAEHKRFVRGALRAYGVALVLVVLAVALWKGF